MSLLGARRIPSGLQVIPSSRWSASALASSSSSPSTVRTVASMSSGMLWPAACSCPRTFRVSPVEHGVVGLEPDLWVLGDVEELGRSQVLVAFGQLGVEAVGVDDERDGGPPVELERAVVAVEVALDGHQPVEMADVELDARAGRVKSPGAGREVGRAGGGRDCVGCHRWVLSGSRNRGRMLDVVAEPELGACQGVVVERVVAVGERVGAPRAAGVSRTEADRSSAGAAVADRIQLARRFDLGAEETGGSNSLARPRVDQALTTCSEAVKTRSAWSRLVCSSQ